MSSIERTLAEIGSQIADMRTRANAPEALRTVPSISAWCPAQHVDHLRKSTRSVLQRLAVPDPPPLGRGITLLGRLVLGLGWIPRGRGKSPERMRGTCAASTELLAALDELQSLANGLDAVALGALRIPVVPHPKFGGLTPAQALRFVSIHNAHHLRIIDEIARA